MKDFEKILINRCRLTRIDPERCSVFGFLTLQIAQGELRLPNSAHPPYTNLSWFTFPIRIQLSAKLFSYAVTKAWTLNECLDRRHQRLRIAWDTGAGGSGNFRTKTKPLVHYSEKFQRELEVQQICFCLRMFHLEFPLHPVDLCAYPYAKSLFPPVQYGKRDKSTHCFLVRSYTNL